MKAFKFNKIIALMLTFFVCFTSIPFGSVTVKAAGMPWEGDGTQGNPYLIYNMEDLKAIQPTSLNNYYKSVFFKLANDVTVDNTFLPIGYTSDSIGADFSGTLDGDGHSILGIDITGIGIGGIFHKLKGATVKNLSVYGRIIPKEINTKGFVVGGIASQSGFSSLIDNCEMHIDFKGTPSRIENSSDSFLGGVIGLLTSSTYITNCRIYGSISAGKDIGYADYVGGLVGNANSLLVSYNNLIAMSKIQGYDDQPAKSVIVGGISGRGTNVNFSNTVIVTKDYYAFNPANKSEKEYVYEDWASRVINSHGVCTVTNFAATVSPPPHVYVIETPHDFYTSACYIPNEESISLLKQYTESYMKSTEFIDELNNNLNVRFNGIVVPELLPWKIGENGFPTHESTTINVTTNSEGSGKINSASGMAEYKSFLGTNFNYTITPLNGAHILEAYYTLNGVTQPIEISNNSLPITGTIKATGDIEVYARFSNVYTVTPILLEGGTITPNTPTYVREGESQTFTIKANSGYRLLDIAVDGISIPHSEISVENGEYVVTVDVTDNDRTITSVFAPAAEVSTVKITAGKGGTASPLGDVNLYKGQTLVVAFNPNNGFSVSGLTIDGNYMPYDQTFYTFTNIQEDHTIDVEFSSNLKTFTILASTFDENGTISPVEGSVIEGDSHTVTFKPHKGYAVSAISINGEEIIPYTASSYTFSNVSSDNSIVVYFEVADFTINVESQTGGNISVDKTGAKAGDTITVFATANSGYKLVEGSLCYKYVDDNGLTQTVSISGSSFQMPIHDVTIAASFVEAPTYNITVLAQNGEVHVNKSVAYEGEEVVITSVQPNEGYSYVPHSLKYNGTLINDATDATMAKFIMPDTDVTITAQFEPLVTYKITTEFDKTQGNVEVLGGETVIPGEARKFKVTANPGFVITGAYVNDKRVTLSALQEYTLADINSDITFKATFIPTQYTVSFMDKNSAVIRKYTADYDTKLAVPTPPEVINHRFTGWVDAFTGDPVDCSNNEYVVKENKFIIATYEKLNTTQYTVRFTNKATTTEVLVNAGMSVIPPAISDPTFIGWFTAETGGSQVTGASFASVNADATYYARYSQTGTGAKEVYGYLYYYKDGVNFPASNHKIVATKGTSTYEATTTEDGYFKFVEPAGFLSTYTLKVYKPNSNVLVDYTGSFKVGTTNQTVTNLGSFVIKPLVKDVALYVKEEGKVVPNATVSMVSTDMGVEMVVKTDSQGKAQFKEVPYTTALPSYVIKAIHTNGDSISTGFNMRVESEYTFNFIPRLEVGGKVTHMFGDKMPLVLVEAVELDSKGVPTGITLLTATDENGQYLFKRLNKGNYIIRLANVMEYSSTPLSYNLFVGDNYYDKDFELSLAVNLKGNVTVDGKLVSYGGVTLYKGDQQVAVGTIENGAYNLKGAIKEPSSDYKLVVNFAKNDKGENIVFTPQNEDEKKVAPVEAQDFLAGKNTKQKDISLVTVAKPSKLLGEANFNSNIAFVNEKDSLVIKYSNTQPNSTIIPNATFKVEYQEGLEELQLNGSYVSKAVTNIQPNASGRIALPVQVTTNKNRFLTAIVFVSYDNGKTYEYFANASIEVISMTLSGAEYVNPTEKFTLFGIAPKDSVVAIKRVGGDSSGEVLGYTVALGKYYFYTLSEPRKGTYTYIAESEVAGSTTVSNTHTVKIDSSPVLDSFKQNSVTFRRSSNQDFYSANIFTDSFGITPEYYFGATFKYVGGEIKNVVYQLEKSSYKTGNSTHEGDWWNNKIPSGKTPTGQVMLYAYVTDNYGEVFKIPVCLYTVLIDPSGQVTDEETDQPLEGVEVVCEVLEDSGWEFWNADHYLQRNPLITDKKGHYGWMVPEGKYRVLANKAGYHSFSTDAVENPDNIKDITVMPVRDDVHFAMKPLQPTTSITLPSSIKLGVGETKAVNAVVEPVQKLPALTSSNSDVVEVLPGGKLLGKSEGTAQITARAGNVSASVAVTVKGAYTGPAERYPDNSGNDDTESTTLEDTTNNAGTKTDFTNDMFAKTGSVSLKPTISNGLGLATVSVTVSQVETALNKMAENGLKVFEIIAEKANGVNSYEVSISKEAFKELLKCEATVINTPLAKISLTKSVLKEIEKVKQENVKVKVTENADGSFYLSISVGGLYVTSFGGNDITVSVPLKKAENSATTVVYTVSSDGKHVILPMSKVIGSNMFFITKHLTKFAIKNNAVSFNDTKDSWANDYIEYTATRELFSGVGNQMFAPNQNMTRAMLVTVLGKLNEVNASNYKNKSSFSDVKQDMWYAPYVAWATENGIVSGVGNNNFDPNEPVTREQMAVIISKFIKTNKYSFKNTQQVERFNDSGNISSWAKDDVTQIQKIGLMGGKTGNNFDPKAFATRAEVSTVFTKFIESMLAE